MPSIINFKGCETCTLRHEWPRLGHPQMPMAVPEIPNNYRVVVI